RRSRKRRKVSWSPDIPPLAPSKPTPDKPAPSRPAPQISMINAVAFHCCLKMPDVQVFQLHISELSPDTTVNEGDPDLTKIPPEYHEFANEYSKRYPEK